MSNPDVTQTALIVLTFVLAGWVKGVAGLGLPTVAMGLLALMMPPVQAAALLVAPSLVTNLWQTLRGPSLVALSRRLGSMMLGMCVGTALGIGLLTSAASVWPSIALGAVLAAYALVGLLMPRLTIPERLQGRLSPIVGVTTGVLTGATGVFVVPAVPYLSAIGLSKEELFQALGLSFTVSTLALAAGLATSGRYPADAALWSALAVLPAWLGMLIGQRVRSRLGAQTFRRYFLWSMLLVGVFMVVRAAR